MKWLSNWVYSLFPFVELKLRYSVETHITLLGFVIVARALWPIVAMPPFATTMVLISEDAN